MSESERRPEDHRDEQAAADPDEREQAPQQDETDSGLFDTDEHSDAPGPFGTG